MFLSAEVRWFWHKDCPQPLHDWFFKTGLPPGGGHPRVDRYLAHANGAEIGIKKRGNTPGLEIKGLVATRRSAKLLTIASHLEIWCKWPCSIADLQWPHELAVTKKRWLRKFDIAGAAAVEIPLEPNENPKSGYALPVQGCNVELTEVRLQDRPDVWWTLGFEAFGDLDSAPDNLTRVVLPDVSALASIVSSGAFLSYPRWLLSGARHVA